MYRITEKPKGWVVEKQISIWSLFGIKKKWTPFVKTSGMDCCWNHSSRKHALINLRSHIDKSDVKIEAMSKKKLYPCPYCKATTCDLKKPCMGCEVFAEAYSKSTEPKLRVFSRLDSPLGKEIGENEKRK